jgi:hypothetical protein
LFQAHDVIGRQHLDEVTAAGIETRHLRRTGEAKGLIFFQLGNGGWHHPAPGYGVGSPSGNILGRYVNGNFGQPSQAACPVMVNNSWVGDISTRIPPHIVA